MSHLPCRIRSDAGRATVSHQDFLDVVGGDAGTRQGGPCRDRPEFRGVHVLERTAELANGGAGGPQNHNLARRLNYTGHLKKDDIKRMFKNTCVYEDFRTFARPLSPINISLTVVYGAFAPHFRRFLEYHFLVTLLLYMSVVVCFPKEER